MMIDGIKKIGIIDFGMFIINTPKIQSALFGLTELYIKERDLTYNYVKHVNSCLEQTVDESQMTETQFQSINKTSKELITDMIEGRLTENNIRKCIKNMKSQIPNIPVILDINLIKILLGNTMACATLFSMTNDIVLVGEIQKRTFKEIIS
jgi:hypothetical protein